MAGNGSGSSSGPSWTVQGQTERTVIGPSGSPLAVVTVTFRLGDGTTGTVDVPAANYTVDAVRDAIAAKAAVLHAVGNLAGS